jgi:protein O-GlcNAc transferase
MLYNEVLRRDAHNFDATHMLGVIALQTRDYAQAYSLIGQALLFNPTHAQALANMGSACVYIGRPDEALGYYERALQANPRFAGVLNNRGNMEQLLGRHAEAAVSFARLLELDPAFDFAIGNLFQSRRHCCDWRDFERLTGEILAGLDGAKRVDRPFSFLSVSGVAAQQLRCAQIYAAYLCPQSHAPLWNGERYGHGRIRIAYVSADFRNHVVSNLMAAIYEKHDRRRFETFGVSLAPEDDSEIVQRAKRALDEFIDVSRLSDDEAAKLLRKLEVDIAVDLTGFTQGCRPGIFARRPAPVQVNFLGIPATMGVPYMDYIIADEFVVPESSEPAYSEHIARLPDSFQANDDRRAALGDLPMPSRAEWGLPATGTVLCSFNNSYKLNPKFFDIWTRVMRQVPDCVLWLVAGDDVRQQLREAAISRAVEANRLVFADRVPYAQHLSRLRLADLFLDTLPFNAGATASDALWAGVPILTCAGEAFASRMAGSLLRSAGLPELITFDERQYEECALALAADPARLADLKARLSANQLTNPLFDIDRYCRHLEAAYIGMWQRVERLEPAVSFNVTPVPG